MKAAPRLVAHWSWFALATVLLLLGTASWVALRQNFDEDLKLTRESSARELHVIAAFISVELQAGRYQDIERLLRDWGKTNSSIAQLQLVAANGFMLATYQRPGDVERALTLEQPISYSYRGEATLRLRIDLADMYRHQQRLTTEFTIILAVGASLLSLLVYVALQRQREAARLRQRTQELDVATHALAKSEERLKLALEASSDGLWDWDVQANTAHFSPRWKAILGYADDELADSFETWYQRLHPEDQPRARAAQQAHFDDPARAYEPEYRMRHKNGNWVWIQSRGKVVERDAAGQPQRMVGTITDITARKRAEAERERLLAELTAANVEMENFVYTISHDLKSPLITIGGFASLVEKDIAKLDGEAAADSIAEIKKAVADMQVLIENLLQLARLGHVAGEAREVDINALLDERRVRCARQIKQTHATIHIAPDIPRLWVDPVRLGEVLQNLVDNALKYHRPGVPPEIEIGWRHEGKWFRLYVRDNGIGIKKEYQERIFELFQRLDSHTDGTGVGLTISRRIIESHGGHLTAESEPGQGSTFWIALPESVMVKQAAQVVTRDIHLQG